MTIEAFKIHPPHALAGRLAPAQEAVRRLQRLAAGERAGKAGRNGDHHQDVRSEVDHGGRMMARRRAPECFSRRGSCDPARDFVRRGWRS